MDIFINLLFLYLIKIEKLLISSPQHIQDWKIDVLFLI